MTREGHCPSCRCHELPTPVPVKVGDRVRHRLKDEVGTVTELLEPNPPWYPGGVPFVVIAEANGTNRPDGYWHYYDLVNDEDS